MNGRARPTLFLMEQVIVIAVFAVCASVFASVFTDSFLRAQKASDVSHALLAAKNSAECFKALGDAELAAEVLRGSSDTGDPLSVYYDADWQVSGAEDARYILRLSESGGTSRPLLCGLTVSRRDGTELVALTVAGRGGEAG